MPCVRDVWLLSLPLILSGVMHMLVVRRNWFAALRRPIHERLFGANKTWRGVVVMPLGAMLGTAVASWQQSLLVEPHAIRPLAGVHWAVLGFFLGLAYVLFELPNSWLKRRLGAPPGQRPVAYRPYFVLLDHSDSVTGCVLVYAWLTRAPAASVLASALSGPLIHLLVNAGLYLVGIRRSETRYP